MIRRLFSPQRMLFYPAFVCLFVCLLLRVKNGWLEFAGLENDGVEQEQTYKLHPMKNFNVYDM